MAPLITFCIRNYKFTLLLIIGCIVGGVVSFALLKIDFMPRIELPTITIYTRYEPGRSERVESLITRQVEEAVSVTDGLRRIRSLSRDGVSVVELFFDWHYDIDRAVIDVRKNLDFIKNVLPRESARPIIVRGKNRDATAIVAVTPGTMEGFSFERELRRVIAGRYSRLPGCAQAEITGLANYEVKVEVNGGKLAGYGLDHADLVAAISSANIQYPAGKVYGEDLEYPVRIEGGLTSPKELESVPVTVGGEFRTTLGEVAKIGYGEEFVEEVILLDGEKCIAIEIRREFQANPVLLCDAVKTVTKELNESYGDRISLTVLYEEAPQIRNAFFSLISSILIGILIGGLLLYLFYRNFAITLLILSSVPITLTLLFFFLKLAGIPLNLMTLGGIALASVLDVAILVTDRILGVGDTSNKDGGERLIRQVKRVAGTVASSSISTCIIFLPIFFMKGLLPAIFREMALTLTLTIVTSIAVSLLAIPVIYRFISEHAGESSLGKALRQKNKTDELPYPLNQIPIRGAVKSLSSARTLITVGVVLIFIGIVAVGQLKRELLPFTETRSFTLFATLDADSTLGRTRGCAEKISRELLGSPFSAERVIASVGFSSDSVRFYDTLRDRHIAEFRVQHLGSSLKAESGVEALEAKIRKEYPDLKLTLVHGAPEFARYLRDNRAAGANIITCEERGDLTNVVSKLVGRDWKTYTFRSGLHLSLSSDRTSDRKVVPAYIAAEIKGRLEGGDDLYLPLKDQYLKVKVTLTDEDKSTLLADCKVKNLEGILVPISDAFEIKEERAELSRFRMNRQPVWYLPNGDVNLNSISPSPHPTKPHLIPDFLSAEISESLRSFLFALAISIGLILLLLIGTTNSLTTPLYIASSIIPSIVCGALALWITRTPLSLFAAIGLFLLTGSAVNNALLLFEALEEFKDPAEAAFSRLRPMLLTTGTSIATIIPIAFNFSAGNEYNQAIALVLVTGLTASLVYTAIFLPAILGRSKVK